MRKNKSNSARSSSRGYTILELSVVTFIAGIMTTAGFELVKNWNSEGAMTSNKQRLTGIQQALANYQTQYNRLPCPASFIVPSSDVTFGHEIVPSCTGYVPDNLNTFAALGRSGTIDSSGITYPVPNPPVVIIGALPVRDLGLPDAYATDTYGNMYTYALTQSEATAPFNPFAGAIDVVDANGNSALPFGSDNISKGTAPYVVVDPGKDGKGAFTLNSGSTVPLVPCASTAGMDTINCTYIGASPIQFRSMPYSTNPGSLTWFDDMVIYPLNTSTVAGSKACVTKYSPSPPASAGTSAGHHLYGTDAGPFAGIGTEVAIVFAFVNWFHVDIATPVTYTATSPLADAYCPVNYNLITGGCTQTAGVPKNSATVPINAAATNGPVAADGSGVYMGGILFTGLETGFGTVQGHDYQTILPPLSHPAMPAATGQQGWECNGSSASGEQAQAYAVCCSASGG